jgi:hypothetical protein
MADEEAETWALIRDVLELARVEARLSSSRSMGFNCHSHFGIDKTAFLASAYTRHRELGNRGVTFSRAKPHLRQFYIDTSLLSDSTLVPPAWCEAEEVAEEEDAEDEEEEEEEAAVAAAAGEEEEEEEEEAVKVVYDVPEGKRDRSCDFSARHLLRCYKQIRVTVKKLVKDISDLSVQSKSEGRSINMYEQLVEKVISALISYTGLAFVDDTLIVDELATWLKTFQTQGTRDHADEVTFKSIVFATFPQGKMSAKTFAKRIGISRESKPLKIKADYAMQDAERDGEEQEVVIFPTQLVGSKRAERSDHKDLREAWGFWHYACTLDTDADRKTIVVGPDGAQEVHKTHVQADTNEAMYEMYLASEYHARFEAANPDDPTLCFSLFMAAKCKCILRNKWDKCANWIEVQMKILLDAWAELRREDEKLHKDEEACTCPAHAVAGYEDAHKSLNHFKKWFCCGAIQLGDPLPLFGEPQGEVLQRNLENAAKKAKTAVEKGAPLAMGSRVKMEQALPIDTRHELLLYPLKCAKGKCSDCGPSKRTFCTRLVGRERSKKVNKYSLVAMQNGGRAVEKLVPVEMTSKQIFTFITKHAKDEYIEHNWEMKWDAHQRKLLMTTYSPEDTLVCLTDFSATLDLFGQHRLTCEIANHAIQDVFAVISNREVVHHSTRGFPILKQKVESWHFWGEQREHQIDANYHYHNACLDHIIVHEKAEFLKRGKELKHVCISSDGCGEQYKSRRNAWKIKELAKRHGLVSAVHTCAPTACFKGCVDALGYDPKFWYNREEKHNNIRAADAVSLYKCIIGYQGNDPMPSPKQLANDDRRQPMTLTARHHRFVIDRSWDLGELPGVIYTDFATEGVDCKELKGIMSLKQFRSTPDDTLFTRTYSCFCSNCIAHNYAACAFAHITGGWRARDMYRLPFALPKSNRKLARIYCIMYSKIKKDDDVVVALKAHDDSVVFCRVVKGYFQANEANTNIVFPATAKTYKAKSNEAMIRVRPLEAAPHEERCYVESAHDEMDIPLRATILPTQGEVQDHSDTFKYDWIDVEERTLVAAPAIDGGGGGGRVLLKLARLCIDKIIALAAAAQE